MKELNRIDIEAILPHRRPILYLETARIIEPGNVTGKLTDLTHPDFAYLGGHFPGLPIFPGAFLTESLAQLTGIAAYSAGGVESEGKVGVLTEDHMKYRQKILPVESTLAELEAKIISLNRRGGKAVVRALKEGKVAAEGEISFLMVNKSEWPSNIKLITLA